MFKLTKPETTTLLTKMLEKCVADPVGNRKISIIIIRGYYVVFDMTKNIKTIITSIQSFNGHQTWNDKVIYSYQNTKYDIEGTISFMLEAINKLCTVSHNGDVSVLPRDSPLEYDALILSPPDEQYLEIKVNLEVLIYDIGTFATLNSEKVVIFFYKSLDKKIAIYAKSNNDSTFSVSIVFFCSTETYVRCYKFIMTDDLSYYANNLGTMYNDFFYRKVKKFKIL